MSGAAPRAADAAGASGASVARVAAPDLVVDSATGVAVSLAIVAPGGRTVAFVIDWHIRAVLALAWFAIGAILYNRGWSLAAPLDADSLWFGAVVAPAIALYMLYHPVLEIAMRGRTPGKRMTGLRIVTRDGGTPTAGALLLRNVFRLVDSFPGVYVVGLVATFVTRQHVRLGDLAAGTVLVYEHAHPDVVSRLIGSSSEGAARDPAMLELLGELEGRWADLEPEARRRLAARLLQRLEPAVAWIERPEEELRATLVRYAHGAAGAPPRQPRTREAALRTALLARAPLWNAARAGLDALAAGRAKDAREASQAIEDYRALARDLATARRVMPESRAREMLETTYARAHSLVHRPAVHPGYAAWSLFRDQIPEVLSQLRIHIFWTTLLFLGAGFAGAWLVTSYPDLIGLFASPEMIATVERGDLWTDNLLNVMPSSVLSVQILTNNIVVSLFAFCAGFLFGLGTFYIVGLNGLMLGGIFAFTAQHGLAGRLFEFVVAHGVVELSVIVLAGAAGAGVGEALVRPSAATRAESFALAARQNGKLLLACAVLLLGCGFIEGYVSPNPDVPLWTRVVVGFGYFLFMIALLRGWLFGRSRDLQPIPA